MRKCRRRQSAPDGQRGEQLEQVRRVVEVDEVERGAAEDVVRREAVGRLHGRRDPEVAPLEVVQRHDVGRRLGEQAEGALGVARGARAAREIEHGRGRWRGHAALSSVIDVQS
jgi:hypothetical protein